MAAAQARVNEAYLKSISEKTRNEPPTVDPDKAAFLDACRGAGWWEAKWKPEAERIWRHHGNLNEALTVIEEKVKAAQAR